MPGQLADEDVRLGVHAVDAGEGTPQAARSRPIGTLAGVAGQEVSISLGPRGATVSQDATSSTPRNVPDGALDLVASRATAPSPLDYDATKLIIRRGLNLPDGAVIPVLDFAAA